MNAHSFYNASIRKIKPIIDNLQKNMQYMTKRPNHDERAQERRVQIVDAARQCVVRYGFHASTMAEIAATAKMSVGLIYRYFPNKDAIARAIVESVVNRTEPPSIPRRSEEIPGDVARRMLSEPPPEERENQMLLLEVHVEATRNPVVAEIIERTDVEFRERFLANVYKDFPAFDREEAAARMEMLAAIVNGTTMRRLARPGPPSERLVMVYSEIISSLLQAKTPSTTAQAPGTRPEPPVAQPDIPKVGIAPAPARKRQR
jgi:AcrR family transcriptional regulator